MYDTIQSNINKNNVRGKNSIEMYIRVMCTQYDVNGKGWISLRQC